jgi:Isochorismatase family
MHIIPRDYTLLCIDLQSKFGVHHHSRVVNSAEREIRQAITDDSPIVMVEYKNCGPTVDQLLDLTMQHSKVHRIEKIGDDGSEEVMTTIKEHKLPHDYLKVCGVNTDICVYCTIYSIHKHWPHTHIEIVADACNSQWGEPSHIRGLSNLERIGCCISRNEKIS